MNENSLLFVAAGIIVAVFALIIFLAIDASTEEDIEIDPASGQIPGFEQMREFRNDAKETIQNNEVMTKFKGLFGDSESKEKSNEKKIRNESTSSNDSEP